eukprot:1506702-Amphidinium_carterae.1
MPQLNNFVDHYIELSFTSTRTVEFLSHFQHTFPRPHRPLPLQSHLPNIYSTTHKWYINDLPRVSRALITVLLAPPADHYV